MTSNEKKDTQQKHIRQLTTDPNTDKIIEEIMVHAFFLPEDQRAFYIGEQCKAHGIRNNKRVKMYQEYYEEATRDLIQKEAHS